MAVILIIRHSNITSNDPEAAAREVDIRMQRMRMQSSLAKGGAR